MIGQERTVLPLLAEQVFALGAFTAALTYIVAFGITKALTNLAAGSLSDRYGRKPVLVAGWLIGLPVPLHADLGAPLGLGRGRQRPARHQPGPDLVHHHRHEDRPGRPVPARPGHGPQRSGRLHRRRRHRAGHRLARRRVRATPRPVLPRHRLRRPRPRTVHSVRPGDPPPRPARGPPPPGPQRRHAQHPADLHPHQLPGTGPVRRQPGRAW